MHSSESLEINMCKSKNVNKQDNINPQLTSIQDYNQKWSFHHMYMISYRQQFFCVYIHIDWHKAICLHDCGYFINSSIAFDRGYSTCTHGVYQSLQHAWVKHQNNTIHKTINYMQVRLNPEWQKDQWAQGNIICNEPGEVKGQDHTNNEQTQSVDDII